MANTKRSSIRSYFKRINSVGEYKLSFILLIFCLIFSPPIIPQVNTGMIACFITLAMLLTKYKGKIYSTIKRSGILKFAAVISVFLVYLAIVTIINVLVSGEHVQFMHFVKIWYRFFLIIPALLICSTYICVRASELEYSTRKLCMCFVWAAVIQSGLALATLVLPQVKEILVSVMYNHTGDSYLNIPWVVARRGFGFANSFIDSFGLGIGIIAALPLFFMRKDNLSTALFVPVILFVSIVNARIGLIIAVIGILFSLPVLIKTARKAKFWERWAMTSSIIGTIAILGILIGLVLIFNPVTIQWVLGGFVSTLPSESVGKSVVPEILYNVKYDSYLASAKVLFSKEFWNIPLDLRLLFGSGHTLLDANGYATSQVGYINDIWLGGLLGCCLLYTAFINLISKAYKTTTKNRYKYMVLFLAVSMAIFQIKTSVITFGTALNTVLPILFYIVYRNSNRAYFETEGLMNFFPEKVSVIVPVYNVANSLEKCIKSLRYQSYRNIEIILVDDGSTDKSSQICDFYAKKDKHITVIHKENGGLADARNAGVAAATGDYIAFVNGDDFVHEDFIAALIMACEKNNTDMATCGYIIHFNDNNQMVIRGEKTECLSSEDAIKNIFLMNKKVGVMVWNKLYKRSLFEGGISYPVGKMYDDVATTYKLVDKANSIACIGLPLYYSVQKKDSIIGDKFSLEHMQLPEVVEKIAPFVEQHRSNFKKEYQIYAFLNDLILLNSMVVAKNRNHELCVQQQKKVLDEAYKLQLNPYFSNRYKILVAILKLGIPAYTCYRKMRNNIKLIKAAL